MFVFCVALLLVGLWSLPAGAVCSAADLIAAEGGCASGVCRLRGTHVIEDGCLLDLSAYDVVLESGARWNVNARSMELRARSLVLRTGSFIDGRGVAGSGVGARGGWVRLSTTGNLVVEGGSPRARIDVSANDGAGGIELVAGGALAILGRLLATNLTSAAAGGTIKLISSGPLTVDSSAELDFSGGFASSGGGQVDIESKADVSISAPLRGVGSVGGSVRMWTAGTGTLGEIRLNGTGDAGNGGEVFISALRGLELTGPVLLGGSTRLATNGGDGGMAWFESRFGSVRIGGNVLAEGAEPAGFGGAVRLIAAADLRLSNAGTVSVRGNGSQSSAGVVAIEAGRQLIWEGSVDASGGLAGGEVTATARGDVLFSGSLLATGRAEGSRGGEVVIAAGGTSGFGPETGALSITGTIDLGASGCGTEGCGTAGAATFAGCVVTVEQTARLFARAAGEGGEIAIFARSDLVVDGTVDARRASASGIDGAVEIVTPVGAAPRIRPGAVAPVPEMRRVAQCSAEDEEGSAACLLPCPECGDGFQEFPEQCDDGNRTSCDGCSSTCRIESCTAANCTHCNSVLGCPPQDLPCLAPATPTASRTSAASPTPSPTIAGVGGSPTVSATPTRTESPTSTPAFSETLSPSPTTTQPKGWTPGNTPTPTVFVTPTFSPTPLSRYDLQLAPLRPVRIVIRPGQIVVRRRVPVRVERPSGDGDDAVPVRLTVQSSCPPGMVGTNVDFSAGGGKGDAVILKAGQRRVGILSVEAWAGIVPWSGPLSPARCRAEIRATVAFEGNQDPSPRNNWAVLEVDVLDLQSRQPVRAHQTVLVASKGKSVRLRPDRERLEARLRLALRNGDTLDPAGHAIRLLPNDGDCPLGTVKEPPVVSNPLLPPGSVLVRTGRVRQLSVPLFIDRADLSAFYRTKRFRCFLVFDAEGPDGDLDLTNNTTVATVDVLLE